MPRKKTSLTKREIRRIVNRASRVAFLIARRHSATIPEARESARREYRRLRAELLARWSAAQREHARAQLTRWSDRHDCKPYTTGLRLPQHREE